MTSSIYECNTLISVTGDHLPQTSTINEVNFSTNKDSQNYLDGKSIISDVVTYTKFARYLPEKKRRENWTEIVNRYFKMMSTRYANKPEVIDKLQEVKPLIVNKKIVPSMRALQLAGYAIERHNNRIYNCCYLPIKDLKSFSEIFFLLLGGSGVGYSVQKHHVDMIPLTRSNLPTTKEVFKIPDNIEGWCYALIVLFHVYFTENSPGVKFDYSLIRPKGTPLKVTGGKAPGPDTLIKSLDKIEDMLKVIVLRDRRMTPLEAHDIICCESDAVQSGGTRRASLISLFSLDDENMLKCKTGDWYPDHPYRSNANNSVVLLRSETSQEEFNKVWSIVQNSGYGEPGFFWTNDKEVGCNPCAEIALLPYQMCNLSEICVADVNSQEEFENRCDSASFLGTLQASFTDFVSNEKIYSEELEKFIGTNYVQLLRDEWKTTCEKEALIGVSMTGIASGSYINLDITAGAEKVKSSNLYWSKVLGINYAARTTCIKPSGDTSLVMKCSPGVHAYHADHYVRRLKFLESEEITTKLIEMCPELMEQDKNKNGSWYLKLPVSSPKNCIVRNESALNFLGRIKDLFSKWIVPGHVDGINYNNISATVSVKTDEWDEVRTWFWENRFDYNGIAIFPYSDSKYPHQPFTDSNFEEVNQLTKFLHKITLDSIKEEDDKTNLIKEVACAGGACEWR